MIHETLVSKSPLGVQIIQISFPLQVGRLWTEPDVTNGCSLLCCLMFLPLVKRPGRGSETLPPTGHSATWHVKALHWHGNKLSFLSFWQHLSIKSKANCVFHLFWWHFILYYILNTLKRSYFLFYLHVEPDGFVYSTKTICVTDRYNK